MSGDAGAVAAEIDRLFQLAHLAGTSGRWAEAIQHLEHALRLSPDSPETMHPLAIAYAEGGRLDDSTRLLETLIRLAPEDGCAYLQLGLNLGDRERWVEAMAAFETAARLGQDLDVAGSEVARAYRYAGRREEALRVLETLVHRDSGNAGAYKLLADIYREVGRLSDAARACEALLRLAPDDPWAYHTLGTLRLQNEEPGAAVGLLRRALDLNPDDVTSLSNLGIAYNVLGLAEDARATFEMVLRRDPDHVPALEHLASLEVEQERWAEAIATASRVLTLAPTSIIARMALGAAYVCTGDRPRAFEQYRALAEVDLEAAAVLFKGLEVTKAVSSDNWLTPPGAIRIENDKSGTQ